MPVGQNARRFLWVSGLIVMVLPHLSGVALAMHFVHPSQNYSIDFPASWNLNARMISAGGPLTLTNFPAGEYRHGGLLPPGGIEITMLLLPPTLDENVMLVPHSNALHVERSVKSIDHLGILRADYDLPLSSRATYRITSVCVRVSGKLFRIMIMYEHPQPGQNETAATEGALTQIIGSLQGKGGK